MNTFTTTRAFVRRNSAIAIAMVALLVCVLLEPREMQRRSYSFLVTFDISQSMNVADRSIDGNPVSRLAFAREAAAALLERLPCGSRIGWSIFTGRRVLTLLVPVEVCQHYDGLLSALAMIDGNMRWADASGIGKGLHQSIRAVDELADGSHIIFMTDGHEAPPLRAGSRGMPSSSDYDASGIIAGIGGTLPARIPKLDRSGAIVGYWGADEVVQSSDDDAGAHSEELSSRRDVHLARLARLAQLQYAPLDSAEQLASVALEPAYATPQTVLVDFRWLPASLALGLLLWRFRPSWQRRQTAFSAGRH